MNMHNFYKSQPALAFQVLFKSRNCIKSHMFKKLSWLWSTFPAWSERSNSGDGWTKAQTAHGLWLPKCFYLENSNFHSLSSFTKLLPIW